MPHIILEYSSNLDGQIDFPRFLVALRDSALATGVFPIGGVRVRAHRADLSVIASNDTARLVYERRGWSLAGLEGDAAVARYVLDLAAV